ncbi:conjugal transfer protein TrbI [Erythrobacter sp. WH131]|uniref:Conjugal transfer protein TrbI n=2 Tax=Erythrobacter ani TaxID=2827235 RepID=A0ABS6SP29_9SPHN|nr:conjugal transfer protein TrbI [Erythrobacter ani]
MLFNALSASRETAQVPSIIASPDTGAGAIASPPPLRVPERFGTRALPEPVIPAVEARTAVREVPAPAFQRQEPAPLQSFAPRPLETVPPASEPQVVFENRSAPLSAAGEQPRDQEEADRVSASRLLNPSRTIPQGTVIPAVLETALDSTRAGGARALVQRDVFSFDGTRVLIPRGSRLYGGYEANLQRGQNRALVQWTRLIRPDGVTIALDSPSSDPLGRAGIRGKVDTKFLQRFGGAILQSVLDIGVGLAVNEATDGVFVALPGSTQNVQIAEPDAIQPTLKVKHGTSVSVFVARDLDFSSVDR